MQTGLACSVYTDSLFADMWRFFSLPRQAKCIFKISCGNLVSSLVAQPTEKLVLRKGEEEEALSDKLGEISLCCLHSSLRLMKVVGITIQIPINFQSKYFLVNTFPNCLHFELKHFLCLRPDTNRLHLCFDLISAASSLGSSNINLAQKKIG